MDTLDKICRAITIGSFLTLATFTIAIKSENKSDKNYSWLDRNIYTPGAYTAAIAAVAATGTYLVRNRFSESE